MFPRLIINGVDAMRFLGKILESSLSENSELNLFLVGSSRGKLETTKNKEISFQLP